MEHSNKKQMGSNMKKTLLKRTVTEMGHQVTYYTIGLFCTNKNMVHRLNIEMREAEYLKQGVKEISEKILNSFSCVNLKER